MIIAANSFEVVAREWLTKQAWVSHYREKVEAWQAHDVWPYIGGRPIAELTAPEFLAVGRRIEERGLSNRRTGYCRPAGKSCATPSPPGAPSTTLWPTSRTRWHHRRSATMPPSQYALNALAKKLPVGRYPRRRGPSVSADGSHSAALAVLEMLVSDFV